MPASEVSTITGQVKRANSTSRIHGAIELAPRVKRSLPDCRLLHEHGCSLARTEVAVWRCQSLPMRTGRLSGQRPSPPVFGLRIVRRLPWPRLVIRLDDRRYVRAQPTAKIAHFANHPAREIGVTLRRVLHAGHTTSEGDRRLV